MFQALGYAGDLTISGKRTDITLIREPIDLDYTSRKRSIINGVLVKRGWAYAGPRWGNLDKWANTMFGTTNPGAGIVFKTLEDLKVFATNSSLDGRQGIFLMTSDIEGKQVKMDFALPSIITFNANEFSNTVTDFSKTLPTFDDTTP